MGQLTRITHEGQLVAVVVAGQAVIDDALPDESFGHVQAMCMYALDLEYAGQLDQYTDADAEGYARATFATG